MPSFAYSARDMRGQLLEGIVEGASASAVADQLIGGGMTPLRSPRPPRRPSVRRASSSRSARAPRSSMEDLLMFSRQLHSLLKAGIPITRALSGLQSRRASNAQRHRQVRESLESGIELSTSMARQTGVFNHFYIAMIRVGEITGRLDEVFLRLFHHLEFEKLMRGPGAHRLRYPSFVMIVMAVAVAVINLFVIPRSRRSSTVSAPSFPSSRESSWASRVHGRELALHARRHRRCGLRVKSWTKTEDGRHAWDKAKLRLPIAARSHARPRSPASRAASHWRSRAACRVQAMNVVAATVENAYFPCIDKMREGVERGDSVLRTAAAAASSRRSCCR